MIFAADTVWHQWIAVALAIPAFLTVPLLIFLYVRIVVMPRYPKK